MEKRIALVCLLAALSFELIGQPSGCPKIPDTYEWKTNREYKRDEDLVLRTLQWLCTTPLNSEIAARGKANLFVMQWICGSPRIKIQINSDLLPFYIDYPDLLFPYIHGVAQCLMAKNSSCDELKAMVSGFESVAFMIQSDDALKKEKALLPISKASKKNKMQAYVESLMKKPIEK